MFTKLIAGVTVAAALIAGSASMQHAAAAPVGGDVATYRASFCGLQHAARFTVQATQPISILDTARLVVQGNCFRQGAYIFVVDGQTGNQVTPGQQFVA